jgi:2-methylcitrate dehydratase PrpD
MTAITRELARYVAASRLDALPAAVRHEGVRAFVNWVGCAAGGAREGCVERALEVIAEFDGVPAATLVGRREKLDALNAACINSMSSAALSFNDTHFVTVAHPTSPVAAAALALAERRPASGREFVHALVLGVEIQCRVGNILCVPPAECGVGLSMQGLVGGIGAAVAAGKMLGLDERGIATAIGLAANQSGGLREAHATMGSPFTPAHAARCGLLAALLAERGFTCSETMIEGVKGFAASFGLRPNLAAALAGLGQTFEISALAYKPYPCGFVIHPVIDACLDAARGEAIDPARIERVELAVNPLAVQLCNRPEPKNPVEAMVSFQHWAAAALIRRAAGIAEVTEGMVHDGAVSALRRRITALSDPGLGREAARVRVVLKGGKAVEAEVRHCRGSEGRPLADEDISDKTRGLLRTAFAGDAAESILAQCWNIEQAPRVDALAARLSLH